MTSNFTIFVFGDSNLSSVEESKIESLTFTNKYRYKLAGWTGSGPPSPPFFYDRNTPVLDQRFINNNGSISVINETWHNNSSLSTYFFFTSAWYLKEIKSPNEGDKIIFNYVDNGELSYFQSRSSSVNLPNLSEVNVEGNGFFFKSWTSPVEKPIHPPSSAFFWHEFPEKQTFQYTMTEITLKSKRLFTINSESGNGVDFIAITPRHDLVGDKMLEEIRLRNMQGMVKTIKLQYDTLWSPNSFDVFDIGVIGNTGFIFDPSSQYVVKKAQILQQRGVTFTEQQAFEFGAKYGNIIVGEFFRFRISKIIDGDARYEFQYNEGRLPRRFSPEQDQWGYFNNNNQAGSLIKKIFYNGAFQPNATVPQSGLPSLTRWIALKPDLTPLNSAAGANINPDLNKCIIGTLKSIKYPTDGFKEIFYELNTSTSSFPVSALRVREEGEYPDILVGSDYISTKYSYVQGNNPNPLLWRQAFLPRLPYEGIVTASSGIMNPVYKTRGSLVGYRTVTKYTEGLGKSVLTFTTPAQIANEPSRLYEFCFPCPSVEFSIERDQFPFPQDLDVDWKRGLLEKLEVFDNTNKKLVVKSNTYISNPNNLNPEFPISFGFTGKLYSVDITDFFRSGYFEYKSSTGLLQTTTEETYDQYDPGNESKKIVTTTQYTYTRPNQTTVVTDLLPRKVTTVLANGENLISETQFTGDYSISASSPDETANGIFLLQQKKIDNAPIESIQYMQRQEGGQTKRYYLNGSLIKYKEFPSQPDKVYGWQQYQMKTGTGILFTDHSWSSINGTSFNWPASGSHKLVGTFNSYDNFGNPLSSTGADGVTNNYTWGYNNALLTSAVQNPGSSQHQTNYLHQPLVGVTQIADLNGRNLKFTYDNFNRLKLLKDHDDQIQARYRYNYKDGNSSYNGIDFSYATEYTSSTANVIRFTAIGSLEPSTSLSWDFGDASGKDNGNTTELKSYPNPGFYTVRLYATNPEFPTTSASKQIRILPPVNVQITSPSTGTNVTVCGNAPVTCVATTTEGPYTFQWQYNYSGSGSGNFVPVGSTSSTLIFTVGGANGASSAVRCKITDQNGFTRYSNTIVVFYYCNTGGGGGGGGCPSGFWWNPATEQCEPNPQCSEGCFWNGFECVCP